MEHYFRDLAENAIDGMLILREDGVIVYANRQAACIIGYPREQLLERKFHAIIDFEQKDLLVDRFHRRLRGEATPDHYETCFKNIDGRRIPVEISAARTSWQGRPAGLIVFHDISERRRADELIGEQKRRLETLVSNLPGMVYRCHNDDDWTMLIVSEGGRELTGYASDQLLHNESISFETLIHVDDRARVRREVVHCLAEDRSWRVEYRLVTRYGQERWVWEQGRGIADGDGRIRYLEGFVADVTDRRQAAERLRKAEERRARTEQMAYVGELAARLNHEIRNPLATIRAGVELILREEVISDANQGVLETVIGEIRRVNSLVCNLLNAARMERLTPAPVILQQLVQEVTGIFEPLARRQGVLLKTCDCREAVTIVVDGRAFGRFLGNLFINAMDALGEGGEIRVGCRLLDPREVQELYPDYPGQVAAVCVQDDGPGMPSEVAEQAFTPFFTTKKQGTGLGLAIAHDIVESHGGVLCIHSEQGVGTMVTAHFPAGEQPFCATVRGAERERCAACDVREGELCWFFRSLNGEMHRECLDCPVFALSHLPHYRTTDQDEVSICKEPFSW